MAGEERVQVLLLVDAAAAPVERNTLCLACTRLLLCSAGFPYSPGQRLQWNHQLYRSDGEIKSQPKINHFKDVTSDNLNTLFTELERCVEPMNRPLTSPATLLYNAMATSVQDHPWDAPDITSPLRRPSAWQRSRRKPSQNTHPPNNHIFIVSQCPTTETELSAFCGHVESGCVQETLLPRPLLGQLRGRGISLSWVGTGPIHVSEAGCACVHYYSPCRPHLLYPLLMRSWPARGVRLFPWKRSSIHPCSQHRLILRPLSEVKGQPHHKACAGLLLMVSGWHGNHSVHTHTP